MRLDWTHPEQVNSQFIFVNERPSPISVALERALRNARYSFWTKNFDRKQILLESLILLWRNLPLVMYVPWAFWEWLWISVWKPHFVNCVREHILCYCVTRKFTSSTAPGATLDTKKERRLHNKFCIKRIHKASIGSLNQMCFFEFFPISFSWGKNPF